MRPTGGSIRPLRGAADIFTRESGRTRWRKRRQRLSNEASVVAPTVVVRPPVAARSPDRMGVIAPKREGMSDGRFCRSRRLDQIPPGKGTSVKVGDKDVALFNVDGTIYAVDDTCPHAGSSLGTSKLDGTIVTCRAHGMKFDVTTGCFAGTSDTGVTAHQVKIVDGKVLVAVG